jgi:hypothetical protein
LVLIRNIQNFLTPASFKKDHLAFYGEPVHYSFDYVLAAGVKRRAESFLLMARFHHLTVHGFFVVVSEGLPELWVLMRNGCISMPFTPFTPRYKPVDTH